jgi:hypothetical protein
LPRRLSTSALFSPLCSLSSAIISTLSPHIELSTSTCSAPANDRERHSSASSPLLQTHSLPLCPPFFPKIRNSRHSQYCPAWYILPIASKQSRMRTGSDILQAQSTVVSNAKGVNNPPSRYLQPTRLTLTVTAREILETRSKRSDHGRIHLDRRLKWRSIKNKGEPLYPYCMRSFCCFTDADCVCIVGQSAKIGHCCGLPISHNQRASLFPQLIFCRHTITYHHPDLFAD